MTLLQLSTGGAVNAALGGRDFDGDDPVVVLVHGAAMDRTVFQMQTRHLAYSECRVAAIDLPGHGGTPGEPSTTVEQYASWVAETVGALDVGPVHIAGHSLGSFIALEVAANAPDVVASLTMLGTAASMPVHPTLLEAAENNDPLAAELMSGWAFSLDSKLGAHPSPGGSMIGATQALIGRAAPGVLAADLRASSTYEKALTAAAAVGAPTTLVLGAEDRMTPVRGARSLIEAFDDPEVITIPGCGHMMTIEAPAVVREALNPHRR